MMASLKLLARNRLALAGLIVIGAVVALALITPLLPLADPDVTDTPNRFLPPFSEGALPGTDHLGRDLLSRLMWGTRLSLAMGLAAAIIAATIGSAIGIIAGYYGGRTDNLIMRGVDMLMAFPYILLALAIVAALGPGLMNALIAVAAVNVPFFARNIRGITVGITHKEFVDAARLAGMRDRLYKAVGGVDLHVEKGECLGIIGESGSGKSVTALSVMGLVASPPGVITGGAVHFDATTLSARPTRSCGPCEGGGSPISSKTRLPLCIRSTRSGIN